jgi:capsular polysaccharide biosynthesis protein
MFDVLPRVHLLERWRNVIEEYAVPDGLSAVQIESLAVLGISENQLFRLTPDQRVRCQHLCAPSLPGSEGCSPTWVIKFLREQFLRHAETTPGAGPLIYVARGPLSQRPILNEDALISCLERRGFRAISLETHPISEQIAIFRDAHIIVAAHGAGLANLVFSQSSAVIELFSAQYLRPDCYFTLCQQLGVRYDCWVDTHSEDPSNAWGSMIVDIDTIQSKIDLLQDGESRAT